MKISLEPLGEECVVDRVEGGTKVQRNPQTVVSAIDHRQKIIEYPQEDSFSTVTNLYREKEVIRMDERHKRIIQKERQD